MAEENKKSILVVGVTGAGKSTLAERLQAMGREAYSIEDVEGLFSVRRKGTREAFEAYDITNPEHVRSSEWICDAGKLKELLSRQKGPVAYYVGTASNLDELIPLFDELVLLKIRDEILRERLETRERTKEEMGSTEETRELVFEWKDWWENEMLKRGAVVVSADGSPDAVARKLLELA